MTYTIIGTGNMAWFIAHRLHAAGMVCRGIHGKNHQHAIQLAALVSAPVIDDVASIKDDHDCCIIAVSDHAIPEVAEKLTLKKTTVIHTAGAVPLDAIPCANRSVLWFIYSILKNNLPDHRNIPAIIEGSTEHAVETTKQIAKAISDVIHEVDGQQRQWMHITAVFGNNFINHLMTICEQLCKEQNLPFSLLLPILEQTLDRVKMLSPGDIQTGPAKRGDIVTIRKQLSLLASHPHLAEIYKSISSSIEDLYN